MKQLEVSIMGQGYILACPEGGEAVLKAAVDHVDHEMCAIRDAGRVKARERIAVLAALNIAYSLLDQQRALQEGVPADTGFAPAAPAMPPPPPVPAISIDVDGLVQRLDAVLGANNDTPSAA